MGNTFRENEEEISSRFHVYMHAFVHYLSDRITGRMCVCVCREVDIYITIIYWIFKLIAIKRSRCYLRIEHACLVLQRKYARGRRILMVRGKAWELPEDGRSFDLKNRGNDNRLRGISIGWLPELGTWCQTQTDERRVCRWGAKEER